MAALTVLLLVSCTPPPPADAPAADSGGDAAAAPAAAESTDDTVLQFWITWGDNPAQIQALFDQYGEANGVTVQVNAPVVRLVYARLDARNNEATLEQKGPELWKNNWEAEHQQMSTM